MKPDAPPPWGQTCHLSSGAKLDFLQKNPKPFATSALKMAARTCLGKANFATELMRASILLPWLSLLCTCAEAREGPLVRAIIHATPDAGRSSNKGLHVGGSETLRYLPRGHERFGVAVTGSCKTWHLHRAFQLDPFLCRWGRGRRSTKGMGGLSEAVGMAQHEQQTAVPSPNFHSASLGEMYTQVSVCVCVDSLSTHL